MKMKIKTVSSTAMGLKIKVEIKNAVLDTFLILILIPPRYSSQF